VNEVKVSSLMLSSIKLVSRTSNKWHVGKVGELVLPRTSCYSSRHVYLLLWHLAPSFRPYVWPAWRPVAGQRTATTVSSFILLACWTPGVICVPSEFTARTSLKAAARCPSFLSYDKRVWTDLKSACNSGVMNKWNTRIFCFLGSVTV
jgi:hypothetical protein